MRSGNLQPLGQPMNSRGWAVLAVISVLGLGCAAPPVVTGAPQAASFDVDTLTLRRHTRFLAADELMGRDTGSPGELRAADYIVETCRQLGFRPIAGGYRLPVALSRAVVRDGALTVSSPTQSQAFSAPLDFGPAAGVVAALSGFGGRAVFLGIQSEYLSTLPDDLTGTVAVVLDPVLDVAAGRALRERGVVGVVHLVLDDDTRRFVRRLRGDDPIYLDDPTVESSFFADLPSVYVWPELALRLVRSSQNDLRGPTPVEFGFRIDVRIDFVARPVSASNVGCVLPGAHPNQRDYAIALTAHYDHLGTVNSGAAGPGPDSIYNGFSDNAAGVAMLLAIGESLTRRPRPLGHSVLFLFLTGEEKGLLGSDAYVANPAWPLAQTLGVVNLDAGAPPARPWSWRVAGGDQSALGNLARDVGAERGWAVTTSPATPNSDYFPFARRGVPAVFPIPGPGPYEGLSADSSDALRARWDRYHQLGDEWFEDFPFEGLARYAEFAYRIVVAMERLSSGS